MLSFRALCVLTATLATLVTGFGQVVINEASFASSERMLQWTASGMPRVGCGIHWMETGFVDTSWLSGNLPAGWGTVVGTNLQSAMLNKTPAAYFRKSFTVSAGQAALTTPVVLQVEYDDGFVAFLNGVEVARANCGPVNHLMVASQPAYNASTSAAIFEIPLGAANTLLTPGNNVLAVQVHNATMGSNFRFNAGLKVLNSVADVTLTKAFYNFGSANGASRTHTNTNGTFTNTAQGIPTPGGWLATAADPASDATWTSLQVVTAELPAAGLAGGGGLRYSFAQSGTNRNVTCFAPSVNMANAWVPGSMTNQTLGTTTLKFRYKLTGDLQLGLRLDPAVNQSANSTDGFPVLGQPLGGAADYDWNTASGGYRRHIISATGSVSTVFSGSFNAGNYDTFSGTACRNGQMTVMEDNTAGAAAGGGTGNLSVIWDTFPTNIDTLGMRVNNITVTEWTAGAITALDFQRTRLSFRWKMPVGRQLAFALEAGTGAALANTVQLGTFTGTGNWESYAVTLGAMANSEALRVRLNQVFTKNVKLALSYAGTSFNNGESAQLDTLNLYYETPGTPLDEDKPLMVSPAQNGRRVLTVDAVGVVTNSVVGTPRNAFSVYGDSALRDFSAEVVEDVTVGGGSGGTTGFLRCAVADSSSVPATWGFVIPGIKVRNWTAGAIAASDLSTATLQFSAKVPSGVTVQLFAEPTGGSTSNRASMGFLTGNGTWQPVSVEFATAGNVENFRAALNAGGTNGFQLNFTCPSAASAGDIISVEDDLQIVPWRTYQTLLSGGANQSRFLAYLNNNNLANFIPSFTKLTGAPTTGATFSIDDFEVTYVGPDPAASQQLLALGASGGAWKYFIGLAEPSGGLYDPALLAPGFTVPVGEEDDYDNPQNFRDWIELKNTTNAAINLANWSLSDDSALPAKWKFPAAGSTIPANGFLVVMCDNREEANGAGTYLHANFELSATGEAVRLYDPAGTLVSAMTNVPEQDPWHTWARNPVGDVFAFSDRQTPGAANGGIFSTDRVKTPDCASPDGAKLDGGFYSTSQTVVLTCGTVGAQIRFTTDGSEPTETNGNLYSTPIVLALTNEKTGVVLRARAFLAGLLPSKTKTRTFLISQHNSLKTLPALSMSGDAGRNFFLPQGVMAINGGTYAGEVWVANGPNSYNMPQGRGDAYERLINAEWIYPDGREGWREAVGLRVSSSPYSRPRLILNNPTASPWASDHRHKPSFNLFWRDDYGNTKLRHATIPDNDVREYKQLRIRAGKNDILNPFIIDELSRRTYRDMGWVQPTGTFCSLYVNGSFKGIFNPTERLREPLFQEHYRTDNLFDVRYIGEQVDGDVVFWNQMQTALNTLNAAPTLANYEAAKNYIDVVNVADYFLFCIYINYDDWPGNNWAAQRERSASGRYRMVSWDMEAAWGRFGLPMSYNTLDSKILNTSSECGDLFKRLYRSDEFKLLFADRIAKHLFNSGVLDDRSATGPLRSLKDSLVAEVQPLVGYVQSPGNPASVAIDLAWFNNHINPTTGRRAYLLGMASTPGTFRNKLLWPETEPPTFSQFGGVTAANYPLTISNTAPTNSIVYYTLDGSDPRLPGGGVSSQALGYSGPLNLNSLVTVSSRVRNANGEWSPMTRAFFQPGAVPPTSSTLVVSEIMYHPPDPTDAEISSGFTDAGDFEFVRLMNLGTSPIDLRELQFTAGITFNFADGAVAALAPNGSVLLVKRRAAFEKRYGVGFGSMIAGEFVGSLNNAGESLKLEWGTVLPRTVIQSFSYSDSAPWPLSPDGFGASLILNVLAPGVDEGNGENWTASAQPGGLPGGGARPMTYATWRGLTFLPGEIGQPAVSGLMADPDQDGLMNLDEYVLGTMPWIADSAGRLPVGGWMDFSGQSYQSMEYRLMGNANDVTVSPQVSGDLSSWLTGSGNVVPVVGPLTNPDGSVSWKVRDVVPFSVAPRRFIRLHYSIP